MKAFFHLLAGLILLIVSNAAQAQSYPSRSARIVALPDVKERLRAIGYVPVGNTPEEFAAQIKSEIAKWEKVICEANIKKIE